MGKKHKKHGKKLLRHPFSNDWDSNGGWGTGLKINNPNMPVEGEPVVPIEVRGLMLMAPRRDGGREIFSVDIPVYLDGEVRSYDLNCDVSSPSGSNNGHKLWRIIVQPIQEEDGVS